MALTARKRKRLEGARTYVREQLALGHEDIGALLADLERRGGAPSRTTLYEWVRTERMAEAADESGPWSLAADDTDRADVVLEVLHARHYHWLGLVRQHSGPPSLGRPRPLTHAEARWVVRISTAAPAILAESPTDGPLRLYLLARDYLRVANDPELLERLDLKLSSESNRADERLARFRDKEMKGGE